MSEQSQFPEGVASNLALPIMQMAGCYLGGQVAGRGGAVAGAITGCLVQTLLGEPGSNTLQTIHLEDFPSSRLDDLLAETPPDDLLAIRQDLYSAFRAAAREAVIDLGGKKCFPDEWKKRGRQSGKLLRSVGSRSTRQSIPAQDEINDLFCLYITSIFSEIDQSNPFAQSEINSSEFKLTCMQFLSSRTYADLGRSLFNGLFLLQPLPEDQNLQVLNEFTSSISNKFLDRFVSNLENQLQIRSFAWQSLNRLLLEAVRRFDWGSQEQNNMMKTPLHNLLDAPDSSSLTSWSEELAGLLVACTTDELRAESDLSSICRRVVTQNGSTRVYLYGLLGVVEQTESLVNRAESVFHSRLNPKQQEHTRRIFMRMTVPGDGCPDSAMRIQISELFPSLEDAPAVEVVLKILAEAGLVRLVRHMVEPSSVSLVQKWPTLRKWLEEDRDGLRLLYQLAEHTRQWTRSRKSNECLLSGARLMEIEEWLKTNPGVTNTHERDFLSASRQKAEQTHIEVEPRLRSELEDSRRVLETEHQRAESYRMQADAEHQRSESLVSSIVRWRIITWGMAIGIILVVVASLISFSAWSTMNQQLESQASAAWIRLTQAAQGIWQAETAQVASTRALIDRATALAETTRIAVQRENALSQSKDFLSYLLAAQASKILASQPDAGLLLAIEANQLKDNRETRSSLIESLQALPYIAHILNGQISDINSVAFSPDGRLVASGAENGDIRIWLAGSGLTVGEMLNSRSGAVNDVAFSPDGKFLASVTGDRNVYIWNLDTKEANILPINDMISSTSISYNPDGKLLAVGGESRNNVAFLLDPNTGKQVGATLVGHTARVQSIVFSPDGQFLASAGWDRTVIIWDKNTQRPILPPFQGPEDRLTKVAFHPEGNIMAASSASRIIYLWNVFTGREIYRLKDGHSNIITGISFSSDGNTLASSSLDGTIQLWNMVNRQKRDQPLKGHVGEVYSVAFHPNGVQLASGGQDQKTMVWDLRADQQLNRNIINGSDIKKAAISPDGRIVAQIDCARFEGSVCLQDEARFWLVSPGSAVLLPGRQPLRDFRQMYGIQFSPDGSIVAVAGCQSEGPVSAPCYQHGVRLYLTLSGQQIGVPLEGHTDTITTMAFSKDGRILATGSRDRSIRIWDGTSGTFSRIVLRSHTGAISALEFSVDGRRMVSAGLDRTIRLWDTSTWLPASQPLRGNNDSIYSLVYTPDGKFFYSGGADRLIVQWDSLTLTPTQSFSTSHTSAISNLAFSPDRSTLYSTGNDRTLRFWDIIDQREIGQAMSGHEGPIHSLNITRDGEILMTASRDRIRVWELNPKAWQAKACQVAGRNLSLKDWSTFIPGEAYRKTCSIWPEGK